MDKMRKNLGTGLQSVTVTFDVQDLVRVMDLQASMEAVMSHQREDENWQLKQINTLFKNILDCAGITTSSTSVFNEQKKEYPLGA